MIRPASSAIWIGKEREEGTLTRELACSNTPVSMEESCLLLASDSITTFLCAICFKDLPLSLPLGPFFPILTMLSLEAPIFKIFWTRALFGLSSWRVGPFFETWC